MATRQYLWLLTLILLLSMPSLCFASQVTIDDDKCFAGYAEELDSSGFTFVFKNCLHSLTGGTGGSTLSSNEHIIALKKKPKSDLSKGASRRAMEVYYENKFCGESGKLGDAPCTRLGQLARITPMGMYAYNCTGHSNSKCTTISTAIRDVLKICDDNNRSKNFCNKIIGDFLNSQACSNASSEAKCRAHFVSRLPGETCHISNYDAKTCAGPFAGEVGTAGISDTELADPIVEPINDASDTGNPGPNDPPITDADAQDLAEVTDQVAQQVFGGGGMAGFGSNIGGASNGNLNVPNPQVNNPTANGPGVSGDFSGAGLNPGSSSALPATARLFPPTRGRPGGASKGGGAAPAAGGGGGAGGGGAIGGGGVNPGGNPGGSRRRGGGGGVSRLNGLAKSMNSGFIGTDGASSGGSGAASSQVQSPLNRKVRAQIQRNNALEAARRASIQKAFNKNLNRSGARDLLMKASFFPSHTEVYLQLNQNADLLDEKGL